jgi:choice-of-anchor B domain-containing protein
MRVIVFVLVFFSFFAKAQTLCENGYAGIYPCENVDLIAHVESIELDGATTNEVWGWTDPLFQKEYVLLGASTGLYFYDITNPVIPIKVGFLPTATFNSSWRTFRTFQNYVFVCSEASGHGMQIFDLTRLRDVVNPPEVFSEDAHYSGFGNCHTLAICEEVGYAYACGTSTFSGGLHIVNIQDPLNPIIAGGYDLNGYTHESNVMVYNGPDPDYLGRTIAFCFNGSVELPVTIVDVTDPLDASTISISTYPQKRYCHQGWLTEDGGYMLIDDELDEYFDLVDSLHTIIFDVHDLDAPVYMGFHVGGTSIDHNQIIQGNICYQSNYTAGFEMIDVSNVSEASLQNVGYFDHFPSNNSQVFQGEWMSYPYFESGIIPVTDIYNGMFLLRPGFMDVLAPDTLCNLEILQLNVIIKEGFAGPFELEFIDLPEGFIPVYDLSNTSSPQNLLIEFDLPLFSGNLQFELVVNGLYYSYSEAVNVVITQPSLFYADSDGDGFGDDFITTFMCESNDGYAFTGGDCNDTDPFIFPDAPGTWENIDNDCNEIIEDDEFYACSDLNNDSFITVLDIQILMGDLFCSGQDCVADINSDGITNITDLIILISDFGEVCP